MPPVNVPTPLLPVDPVPQKWMLSTYKVPEASDSSLIWKIAVLAATYWLRSMSTLFQLLAVTAWVIEFSEPTLISEIFTLVRSGDQRSK